MLSTLKKCEDSDDLIARIYDIEGKERQVQLRLFRPIRSASLVNLIEEEDRGVAPVKGTVRIRVGPCAIETIKLGLP